jgi:hypothetical protein
MAGTTIRADCRTCGYVNVSPDCLTLFYCTNRPNLSYYTFACPTCEQDNRREATATVIGLLLSGSGCNVDRWEVPPEALEAHDGPPISHDDILDLHQALRDL